MPITSPTRQATRTDGGDAKARHDCPGSDVRRLACLRLGRCDQQHSVGGLFRPLPIHTTATPRNVNFNVSWSVRPTNVSLTLGRCSAPRMPPEPQGAAAMRNDPATMPTSHVPLCPNCHTRLNFRRSETAEINSCGFESYRLNCQECGASLVGIIDPADDALVLFGIRSGRTHALAARIIAARFRLFLIRSLRPDAPPGIIIGNSKAAAARGSNVFGASPRTVRRFSVSRRPVLRFESERFRGATAKEHLRCATIP